MSPGRKMHGKTLSRLLKFKYVGIKLQDAKKILKTSVNVKGHKRTF